MGSSVQTTEALRHLLQEVSTAFLVSAAAITSAMLVTLVEKLLISSLYRRTEEIAHDIDARFNAGAGEEYLSRIVHASEDSASQSKILKDALVNDLRDLLREVTSTQINASKEDNQVLASRISGSITESLTQPMKDIAGTVRAASGDQSATASRMLQDVLSSFSQRLNDVFGGQISGISELNRDTAQGMRDVVQTLHVLVTNIESASAKSGDVMAQRMADAVEKMERRQESINSQTTAFVEQLRQLVSASHSETNQKMQEALAVLGQQVGGMVASLTAVNQQSLEGSRRREEGMADRTTLAVTTMTGSVDGAVKEMTAASTRMQDAVATIAQVATSALEKMNYGADTLNTASGSFARAGDRVASAMGQAATVAGKLSELAGAMTAGASALQQTTGDYRTQRDAVSALVTELRTVVESAKREASLTADVLARIESATEKLATAQVQADQYLHGVSKVLGDAHQAFADATTKTLDRANTEFHSKLASGVALLSASIQELETSIGAK
jgi:predicted transcriptional regulator